MNRRSFIAALVSLVGSKFFSQQTAASDLSRNWVQYQHPKWSTQRTSWGTNQRYIESNGTTKLTGSLSWGVNQWQHGSIRLQEGDFIMTGSPGRENSTLRFTDQFSVDPKWHSGNGNSI